MQNMGGYSGKELTSFKECRIIKSLVAEGYARIIYTLKRHENNRSTIAGYHLLSTEVEVFSPLDGRTETMIANEYSSSWF